MAGRLITIFGGSGFLGRYVVRRLAKAGYRIRVAVRNPNLALFLKPLGDVGQIQIVQANLRHQPSVDAACAGADTVINLVGLLYQSGSQSFQDIHVAGAQRVAGAAAEHGVRRLLQLSAIGADAHSVSVYARSKSLGEAAARAAFPKATIIRPGVMFGAEDNFINRFAGLAKLSPFMPLISGNTRLQPVYVGDVAEAIVTIIKADDTAGKTYELGGPQVMRFQEILDYVLHEIQARKIYLPIPLCAAKIMAFFLGLLPTPPLTIDQVRLLSLDNMVGKGALTFQDLGIKPTPLEAVAPAYLWRYRPYGQFSPSQPV